MTAEEIVETIKKAGQVIERQAAENARYKEALREIAYGIISDGSELARQALEDE